MALALSVTIRDIVHVEKTMSYEQIEKNISILIVDFGGQLLGVLVVIFVGWIAAGYVSRLGIGAMRKGKIDDTLTRFCGKLSRWGVLALVGLACLSIFGIETTSFAAVLGAAGLAVGLAFQGTLGNFAAGAMLLVFRPFKVGDVVSVAGQMGKVFELELFTTTLDTPDNRRIIIPNGSIFGSVIENISHHATRRVDVAVGTDYPADLDRTREVLTNASIGVDGRLDDPEPAVVLLELGASSINWSVRVWANAADSEKVKQALTRAVKNALDEAGIGIPYPQMDVHVDNSD